MAAGEGTCLRPRFTSREKESDMRMLGRLFKPKEDPLQKQAATLVAAARASATSMFVPVLDEFPFLQNVDVEQ